MTAEVKLYQSPWVQGAHTTAQLGRVCSEIFVDDREPARVSLWAKATLEVLEELADKARSPACASPRKVSPLFSSQPFDARRGGARPAGRRGAAVRTQSTINTAFVFPADTPAVR